LPDSGARARDLGIPFSGTPGALNAITDVPGLEVGYVTLNYGESVRTGVTAILPRGKNKVGTACSAGFYSLNGNGEMTGTIWVEETGALAMPIMITNTHAVGTVHRGVIDWINKNNPRLAAQWLLPVVAETWDGYLNDINGTHVKTEHAGQAIDSATSGRFQEGSVGGGTGMNCYGFKGGNGSASRIVAYGKDEYVVAAFVQSNFGSREELMIAGVPMGGLDVPNPLDDADWFSQDQINAKVPSGAGSVIVVIATNAPLLPAQCKALAKRVPLGLARTGTAGSHFSGDIFIAFSTANEGSLMSGFPIKDANDKDYDQMKSIQWGRMDPFYTATVQSVEEAVVNALVANVDMVGRNGHISYGLPREQVTAKLVEAGKL
jgi:L-aminopeptidase/D-esterase-like protein